MRVCCVNSSIRDSLPTMTLTHCSHRQGATMGGQPTERLVDTCARCTRLSAHTPGLLHCPLVTRLSLSAHGGMKWRVYGVSDTRSHRGHCRFTTCNQHTLWQWTRYIASALTWTHANCARQMQVSGSTTRSKSTCVGNANRTSGIPLQAWLHGSGLPNVAAS